MRNMKVDQITHDIRKEVGETSNKNKRYAKYLCIRTTDNKINTYDVST